MKHVRNVICYAGLVVICYATLRYAVLWGNKYNRNHRPVSLHLVQSLPPRILKQYENNVNVCRPRYAFPFHPEPSLIHENTTKRNQKFVVETNRSPHNGLHTQPLEEAT